jgi:hypothetical protein
MLLLAALFLSIPAQIIYAQEDQQPPFMESGRPPVEGWALPGHGQSGMEASSSEGDVFASVIWTPAEIGQPNKFLFQFADIDGHAIAPAYSIELLQGNDTVPGSLRQEQTSPVQEYIFNETGIYTLRIHDIQERPATDVINIPLEVTSQQSSTISENTTSVTTAQDGQDKAIQTFHIDGAIGSLVTDLLNVTIRENVTDETPINVLVGNWSMDVVNGEVNYFQVDFIMGLQNGTQMHVYSVENLTNIVIPSSSAEEEGSSPVETFSSNVVIRSTNNYSLSLFGYVDVLTDDVMKWEDVPLSVDIFNGNTVSILLYPSDTDNRFKGQPIYGVVTWIFDENDKPIKPSTWAAK